MAGRQFKSSSLRPEQLQGMGISGKDMPSSAVTPPPTFPPLMTKPALLETNADREFMINWDEQFLAYLKGSPYYTGAENNKQIHSKYFLESSRTENGGFHWHLMPSELRPNFKRKNTADASGKFGKMVSVEEAFKALEQKENSRKPGEKIKDDNDSDKEEVDGEEPDDEMDEDNDYDHNYFDNGESYNEEDDNLDDGPVY